MSRKIKNIEDLKYVVTDRWTELEDIPTKYLNEAGMAARECYRNILWHLSFHDTIAHVKEDKGLMDLINVPSKNPEYYNVLRKFYRVLERLE